ncbi:gata zinc finger domain-containing protein [Cryptosporidium andersoni]|uniref:Gata zinc finger domain-containing protein n=1 Tax=Cryptosporidium andersoni TaxID=117008 RepID=A0A1J4MDH1_9CRYT|nr:gata zinc finger domain-containing protein [Cryptosporidium andersoni]
MVGKIAGHMIAKDVDCWTEDTEFDEDGLKYVKLVKRGNDLSVVSSCDLISDSQSLVSVRTLSADSSLDGYAYSNKFKITPSLGSKDPNEMIMVYHENLSNIYDLSCDSESSLKSGMDCKLKHSNERRAGRPPLDRSDYYCQICSATKTPQWRYISVCSSEAKLRVCNACWMKQRKKRDTRGMLFSMNNSILRNSKLNKENIDSNFIVSASQERYIRSHNLSMERHSEKYELCGYKRNSIKPAPVRSNPYGNNALPIAIPVTSLCNICGSNNPCHCYSNYCHPNFIENNTVLCTNHIQENETLSNITALNNHSLNDISLGQNSVISNHNISGNISIVPHNKAKTSNLDNRNSPNSNCNSDNNELIRSTNFKDCTRNSDDCNSYYNGKSSMSSNCKSQTFCNKNTYINNKMSISTPVHHQSSTTVSPNTNYCNISSYTSSPCQSFTPYEGPFLEDPNKTMSMSSSLYYYANSQNNRWNEDTTVITTSNVRNYQTDMIPTCVSDSITSNKTSSPFVLDESVPSLSLSPTSNENVNNSNDLLYNKSIESWNSEYLPIDLFSMVSASDKVVLSSQNSQITQFNDALSKIYPNSGSIVFTNNENNRQANCDSWDLEPSSVASYIDTWQTNLWYDSYQSNYCKLS